MCEVSEKIYKMGQDEGKKEGRKEKERETALKLKDMGFSLELIAEATDEDVHVVEQWLSEEAVGK